jgi:hypothetical protein
MIVTKFWAKEKELEVVHNELIAFILKMEKINIDTC